MLRTTLTMAPPPLPLALLLRWFTERGRWREVFGNGPVWKWLLPGPLPPLETPSAMVRRMQAAQR